MEKELEWTQREIMHINSHIASKSMDKSDGFGQLAIQNGDDSESAVNNQFKKLSKIS